MTSGSQEPNLIFPLEAIVQCCLIIYTDFIECNYHKQCELNLFTHTHTHRINRITDGLKFGNMIGTLDFLKQI